MPQQPERVVDRDEVGAIQRGCRQQRPFTACGPRGAKQGEGFIDAGERIARVVDGIVHASMLPAIVVSVKYLF
ncbi:hypothetical protein [Microbacterium sp.]|uniref:hypothetical protein n=1 Tax=Microbacterium sp. TaxID=51671 RepID=UPI003C13FD50